MSVNKLMCTDIETSDLEPEKGQIVSATFSALDVESGKVLDTLSVKFGFRGDIIPSADAIFVNGINVLKQKGKSELDGAETIYKFLMLHGGSNTPFLGHNIDSDIKHIKSLFNKNGFDSRVISYNKVDTFSEGAKAISLGKLSIDKLEEITGSDGKTRRSLRQGSLAKALDIELDESRLHDDAYDVEINRKIWLSLGKPTPDSKLEVNNPYTLEANYSGKIIKSLEWDSFNGRPVEKTFYVTGLGTESGQGKSTNSTVLLRMDGEGFKNSVSLFKSQQEHPDDEKLQKAYLSSIAKISVERKFTSHEWFSVDILENNDDQDLVNVFSEVAFSQIKSQRLEIKEKEFNTLYNFSFKKPFILNDPSNRNGALKFDSYGLVRSTADEISQLNESERCAFISSLANNQVPSRGIVWADKMLRYAIEFGVRNKLNGFEKDRVNLLKAALPEIAETVVFTKTIDEVENVVAKAMKLAGISQIDLICNGKEVKIKCLDVNGAESLGRKIEIVTKENGSLLFPLAADISSELSGLIGISQSASNKLRTGFSAFSDDSSYEAVKVYYGKVILKAEMLGKESEAEALRQTLSFMGDSYDEFINNAAPLIEEKAGVTAFDILKKKINDKKEFSENDSNASKEINVEEILSDYESIEGIRVPLDADSLLILALNLKNPNVEQLKEIDSIVYKSGVYLCVAGEDKDITLEPGELEEGDRHGIRCKVCNRLFNSRNAVAGMGPTCAKKLLEEWLSAPETGDSEVSSQIYQRLSEIKSDSGYPIMLVRDTNTGKTFATDIKARDKDGRYLVVDLSSVMKKGSGAGISSLFRETLKVYLDEENYEVIKIFGAKKY